MLLKDDFESSKCWLDLWLSCMLYCIHICVFTFLKSWFLAGSTPLDTSICRELLRIYREAIELEEKEFFKEEKHKENATSKQLNQRSNQHVNLSKHLSTYMQSIHRSKHTHTHTKQDLPILYLKNKLRQFCEHILTHVFHVMAKSHCTCACIKSSKE